MCAATRELMLAPECGRRRGVGREDGALETSAASRGSEIIRPPVGDEKSMAA